MRTIHPDEETVAQCVECGEYWDADDPNKQATFCPACIQKFRDKYVTNRTPEVNRRVGDYSRG